MSTTNALFQTPYAAGDDAAALSVALYPGDDAAFARLAAIEDTGSAFQSANWLRAYLAAHDETGRFCLIEIEGGGCRLLLPVHLTKLLGIRIATRIGGAHASFFVPPASGHAGVWPARALEGALGEAGRRAGFEALILPDCPANWQGQPHPLLDLPHVSSPSDAAQLSIDLPQEALLARLFDGETRKKQRYKRRKLSELGVLSSGWAPCDLSLEAALTAFFHWKSRQFAAMGIPDPFASTAMRRFLREACCGTHRAVRLFTLHLESRPIAVIGVTLAGRHASGMFTAYDPSPGIARFSPGDVLMADLIAALGAEGCTGFDLGIGEARYKSHFCPEPMPVVDIALPLTPAGRYAVALWRALRRTKRTIKRNRALFDLARRLRRLIAR